MRFVCVCSTGVVLFPSAEEVYFRSAVCSLSFFEAATDVLYSGYYLIARVQSHVDAYAIRIAVLVNPREIL